MHLEYNGWQVLVFLVFLVAAHPEVAPQIGARSTLTWVVFCDPSGWLRWSATRSELSRTSLGNVAGLKTMAMSPARQVSNLTTKSMAHWTKRIQWAANEELGGCEHSFMVRSSSPAIDVGSWSRFPMSLRPLHRETMRATHVQWQRRHSVSPG
jgi:hypothetical protein